MPSDDVAGRVARSKGAANGRRDRRSISDVFMQCVCSAENLVPKTAAACKGAAVGIAIR